MHPERAELSSLSSLLHEVTARITEAAERSDAARDESLAHDLYDVERALQGAQRRLNGALDRLVR
jgi:hypothetical protein